jgi:hypothetical protein
MLKITINEDCGNAPKKLFLRDIYIAFAKNDLQHILQNVSDGIRWNMVGDSLVEGKEQVANVIEAMNHTKATELTIKNIITHGKTAAVDGIVKLENGSRYAFCDVYNFSSSAKDAKIKEVTSYSITL